MPRKVNIRCGVISQHTDDASLLVISATVNSGLALGEERFQDQTEAIIAREARPGKPSNPQQKDIVAMHLEQYIE
jgi:hypothetical protein